MPSLNAFLESTVPVPIRSGDVTVTLYGRVEKVSATGPQGEAYRKLQREEYDIRIAGAELVGAIEEAAQEVAALVEPSPERFADFAETMRAFVQTVRDAVDVEAAADDLREAAARTVDFVAAFEATLLPPPETITKRREAAEKRAKKAEDELKKLRVKRLDNWANRIVFLCSKWDLTRDDSPDSPMVPVSFETVRGFSEGFLEGAVAELEKKALGFSRTTSDSTS